MLCARLRSNSKTTAKHLKHLKHLKQNYSYIPNKLLENNLLSLFVYSKNHVLFLYSGGINSFRADPIELRKRQLLAYSS